MPVDAVTLVFSRSRRPLNCCFCWTILRSIVFCLPWRLFSVLRADPDVDAIQPLFLDFHPKHDCTQSGYASQTSRTEQEGEEGAGKGPRTPCTWTCRTRVWFSDTILWFPSPCLFPHCSQHHPTKIPVHFTRQQFVSFVFLKLLPSGSGSATRGLSAKTFFLFRRILINGTGQVTFLPQSTPRVRDA